MYLSFQIFVVYLSGWMLMSVVEWEYFIVMSILAELGSTIKENQEFLFKLLLTNVS